MTRISDGDLPEPPVPSEADLKDFAFTPIYRARLFGSAFHAKANDSEWRAGVTLWLKAQDQVPAGSLPDDDVDLCRLAEFGRDIKTWKKLRAGALHGWEKCSDGRLYNRVVAEVVNEQWTSKVEQRDKRETWREKKRRQREGQPQLSRGTTEPVPLEKALKGQGEGEGEGKGQGQGREEAAPPDHLDAVGKRACEAAGVDLGRMAVDFTAVAKWLGRGDDPELDILPTIRTVASRPGYQPKPLGYFTNAIAEAHRRRLESPPQRGTNGSHAPAVPLTKSGAPPSKNIPVGSAEDIAERLDMGIITEEQAAEERARIHAKRPSNQPERTQK